jgi:hypothetical protein
MTTLKFKEYYSSSCPEMPIPIGTEQEIEINSLQAVDRRDAIIRDKNSRASHVIGLDGVSAILDAARKAGLDLVSVGSRHITDINRDAVAAVEPYRPWWRFGSPSLDKATVRFHGGNEITVYESCSRTAALLGKTCAP